MKEQDLRWILICSFRYSLGRKSYAPSYTCDLIKKYGDVLKAHNLKQMIDDIENFRYDKLDFENVWQDLKVWMENKIVEIEEQ